MFFRMNPIFGRMLVLGCCVFFLSHEATAQELYYVSEGEFVGDGATLYVEHPAIAIDSIPGWTVIHRPSAGITLRFVAPEKVKHLRGRIIRFRPSLNVRTIYSSEAIDTVRATSFQAELEEQFTRKTPLKDFQILDVQRMAIQDEDDALVVFAGFESSGYQMLQVHTLVASKKEQFVMTYTDFHEVLAAQPESLERIWQVMRSLRYEGSPRGRYESLAQGFAAVGVGFALCSLLWFCRRRRQQRKLQDFLSAEPLLPSALLQPRSRSAHATTRKYNAKIRTKEEQIPSIDIGLA